MRRVGNTQVPDWFNAHDARVLARLRTGMATPADISEASATFQPIARRMLAAPLADRKAVADEWLRGVAESEAEAIRQAVVQADPARPAPPEPAPTRTRAILICAADIEPLPVDWLWPGRVPMGMLTMFAGDPKLGKSYVTLSMAAAVSQGAPLPGGDAPEGPASVIIMSAEDDPSRAIVPRLKAAGADLSRVHVLRSVLLIDGHKAMPCLDTDLHAIEEAAAQLGDCRLILIDPISAYLGETDDYRNSDLRRLLAPLGEMAERLQAAVVLVSHLSKGGGANGKRRVMGSMAYVGVCRSNLIFVRDRSDPTGRRVLICDNGGNLATPPPTLAYTIEELSLGPAVVFQPEPVAITTEQALAAEAQEPTDRDQSPDRREAERWLKEVLAAGPLPAREVEEAAKLCGFSLMTLKRAKQSIAVASIRQGFGKDARWTWNLPETGAQDVPTP